MSWIGGKKALRELIVSLFPIYYERYIEVFGGGGWVLFHKPPGNDFEVYNDIRKYSWMPIGLSRMQGRISMLSGRRWHGTAPQVMSSGLHGSIS